MSAARARLYLVCFVTVALLLTVFSFSYAKQIGKDIIVPFDGWPGWHETEFWQMYFEEYNHQYDAPKAIVDDCNSRMLRASTAVFSLSCFNMQYPEALTKF